jgi:hypothetical protein
MLPICVAEGQNILPNTQVVQETAAASSFGEDSFEEIAGTSPMALVEEATEEAMELEGGEVQADIERVIRSAVRHLVATSVQAHSGPGAPQAATKLALTALRGKITQQFVEQAAKKEAVKVAKQHAKAAAARAASRGASAVEQARVARSTATRVAQSFARVARDSGVKLALDELALQRSQPTQLMATEVDEAATSRKDETPTTVSHQISKAATTGVNEAKKTAKQVASQEAAKAGLTKSQTKKLEGEAASAVREAAGALAAHQSKPPAVTPAATTGASDALKKNAAADTDAAVNGEPHGRISVTKAADAGKEKAKKAELSKLQAIAAEEKRKTRLALREAANQEKKAAKFVDNVATNSLARGLDKDLSTKNLKLAASKATTASQQVEIAVKDAVNKALRQKDRLNRANEKVEKAGDSAAKEAQEKNAEARQKQFDIKGKQERQAKLDEKEIKVKKQHANEAAHKAITRVVTAAGEKASRTVARTKASAIQKDFLIAACHRHAQHSIRLVGETEKNKLADRGLSASAQRDGELKALRDHETKVISDTVGNAVRRQAHLSAMNAKKHAAARGLTNAAQLTAARKAWKKAEPEIKSYCEPAAKKAAKAELATPGQAPEAIDQHQFVVKAVKTMKTAVTKACSSATKPLVIDGARLAARHNADYKWQVDKGNLEAAKVCNATVALYTQNAEVKSKEMVTRSFDESAEAKQKSLLFQQRIREDAQDKVLRAKDEAAQKTQEHMNKQCERKTELATHHAKNQAARSAVERLTQDQAKSAAKAAEAKAYQEALADGLSETHAKKLGKEAYDKTYSSTHGSIKAATGGVAPPAPSTTAQLAQLHDEWQHYSEAAQRKRAKEVEAKRIAKETPSPDAHRAAQASLVEASDAEHDANTVHSELQQVQLQVAAREIQVPPELFSDSGDDVLMSMSTHHREARRTALVHAIATAVKSLHQLGGQLPSELHIAKLQAQLQQANRRIAQLEGKSDKVEVVNDVEHAAP